MEDYKGAHLAWLKKTTTFSPKYPQDYRQDIPYYEVIKSLYSNPRVTNDFAYACFLQDKIWFKKSNIVSNMMNKAVESLEPTPNGKWFVTIGFNHQTWNVAKCCKVIEKIMSMEWIISAKANFELFRENGEHPHCHFIIETKEPKSRLLDKMFRPKYVKEVVLAKSFIDCKIMSDYHLKYINLEKQTSKTDYVAKDKDWRKKNNIPDYEKNWNV